MLHAACDGPVICMDAERLNLSKNDRSGNGNGLELSERREKHHFFPSKRNKEQTRYVPQWFTQAPFAYNGRWWNFHVLGALSSELNFKTFFQLLALFCCYAVSFCVYDHNHPYLVSERLFLAENEAFPYLRRALAHLRRALAILWDAAATWPVVIFDQFVVVAAKQRSPKMSVACVQGPVDRLPYRSPPVTLNGHCGVIF